VQLETDQLLKQRLLVGEVEIDRALGDAGAGRHVVEPRGGEAAGGKFVERSVEDRFAPCRSLCLARALARRCRGAVSHPRGRGLYRHFFWSSGHDLYMTDRSVIIKAEFCRCDTLTT